MAGQLTIGWALQDNFTFKAFGEEHGIPNLDTLFQEGWIRQLRLAASSSSLPYIRGRYSNPVISAAEPSGGEVWGVDYGMSLPRGQLGTGSDVAKVDIVHPFLFSGEAFLDAVKKVWVGLISLSQNGRYSLPSQASSCPPLSLCPDPNGPIELLSLTLKGSFPEGGQSRSLSTELKGVYHTPAALPNIPFTVTSTETIDINVMVDELRATYSAASKFAYDDSALKAAIDPIEAALGGAAVAAVTGLGTPLLAGLAAAGLVAGVSEINGWVAGQEPASGQGPSLGFLGFVFQTIPARIMFPGVLQKIVCPIFAFQMFGLDSSTADGIPIASWDADLNEQLFVSIEPDLWFETVTPQLLPREAFVIIQGPESFQFPAHAQQVVQTYQALSNDEVQNPIFSWRVLGKDGMPAPRAQLSSTQGQSVQVTFDVSGVTQQDPLVVSIEVSMDDDLHLLDSSGKPPKAQLGVTATALPAVHPPPPPPPHGRPKPLPE